MLSDFKNKYQVFRSGIVSGTIFSTDEEEDNNPRDLFIVKSKFIYLIKILVCFLKVEDEKKN